MHVTFKTFLMDIRLYVHLYSASHLTLVWNANQFVCCRSITEACVEETLSVSPVLTIVWQ